MGEGEVSGILEKIFEENLDGRTIQVDFSSEEVPIKKLQYTRRRLIERGYNSIVHSLVTPGVYDIFITKIRETRNA